MAQFRTSHKFDVIFLVTLAFVFWWSFVNSQSISDWVFFHSHKPSSEAVQIATDAGLSNVGRQLFYRTGPIFTTKAVVTANCDIESLGCITSGGQVYVIDDPTNHPQTVVVAAHEMLHLAYRRLTSAQKAELEPLLEQGITQNAILGINGELAQEDTPSGRLDEAHSRLGTEYKILPPDLEKYYATYFKDRSRVL